MQTCQKHSHLKIQLNDSVPQSGIISILTSKQPKRTMNKTITNHIKISLKYLFGLTMAKLGLTMLWELLSKILNIKNNQKIIKT